MIIQYNRNTSLCYKKSMIPTKNDNSLDFFLYVRYTICALKGEKVNEIYKI